MGPSNIANVWDSTIQPVNEQRFYLEHKISTCERLATLNPPSVNITNAQRHPVTSNLTYLPVAV